MKWYLFSTVLLVSTLQTKLCVQKYINSAVQRRATALATKFRIILNAILCAVVIQFRPTFVHSAHSCGFSTHIHYIDKTFSSSRNQTIHIRRKETIYTTRESVAPRQSEPYVMMLAYKLLADMISTTAHLYTSFEDKGMYVYGVCLYTIHIL